MIGRLYCCRGLRKKNNEPLASWNFNLQIRIPTCKSKFKKSVYSEPSVLSQKLGNFQQKVIAATTGEICNRPSI